MGQQELHRENDASSAEQLSRLVKAFESAWRQGQQPRLEGWAVRLGPFDYSAVFRELLVAEVLCRRSQGETPTTGEYVSRFPDFRLEIEALFESGVLSKRTDPNWAEPTVDLPGIKAGMLPDVWLTGAQVGRYVLIEMVGRGGFGEVWKATDPQLHRTVAVKVPRKDRELSAEAQDRCENEARLAASLQDPGVVPVYDCGRIPKGVYIVTEFIDGETLSERMKREPIEVFTAVDLVMQVARTLHRVHAKSLYHRDIKPSNILLTKDSRALIADFGLAVTELQQLSESSAVLGTMAYMSPEQVRGESQRVDGRADIYSLGVILYQLLTGRLPFKFSRFTEYLDQVLNREVPPLRAINDRIPIELERICLKALAKTIFNRYTTALDLANDLDRWSNSAKAVPAEPAVDRPVASRRTWLVRSVGGVGAMLLMALTWQVLQGSAGPPVKEAPPLEKAKQAAVLVAPAKAKPVQWQPLFEERPVIIAWQEGGGQSPPVFSRSEDCYSVASRQHNWLATVKGHSGPSVAMQADVEIANWLGLAGVFWDLHTDNESGKGKAWAILLERYSQDAPTITLGVAELVISRRPGDRGDLTETKVIAEVEIPLPLAKFARMEIHADAASLRVLVNDFVWEPKSPFQRRPWLSLQPASMGLTGNGVLVTFRHLKGQIK